MKFCLLVTVALDNLVKEKSDTLYLPWISPLSLFYTKGVYSVNLSGPNFPTPRILQPPPLIRTLSFIRDLIVCKLSVKRAHCPYVTNHILFF